MCFGGSLMECGRKGAGHKAYLTRQINKLRVEYDAQTSAGKKAAIKRKINKLLAERFMGL